MKTKVLELHPVMKLLSLMFVFLAFLACDKIEVKEKYIAKIPILKTLGEVRASSILITEEQPIVSIGKIYLYQDYLFVNEPNKGIHIINNANPSNPKSIGFLPIIGNFDLGIQNDLLYADNIVDLLTFDISNISKPELINRQKNVFSVKYKDAEGKERYYLEDTDLIPVAYKDSLVYDESSREYSPGNELDYNNSEYLNGNNGSGNQVGQAGSLARFAISKNYLFAIFHDKVKNFDLKAPRSPKFVNEVTLGSGIETLFPYKNALFVGANDGMHILDITNPLNPSQLSVYRHMLACDPVVVNDNYAFVTLRTGTTCGGNRNVLEVVNIKDLKNPQQVKVYEMKNPHGLALAGDNIYICEGGFGMKSFKISDVDNIDKNLLQNLENLRSLDVIAGPKSLIVLGPDAIIQFDYSDKANLKQLSKITLNPQNYYL